MNDLEVLTEAVIDKRGFFYHGDRMNPRDFVKTVASGKYENTSSMYGKGMYCVRNPSDAALNPYGPYIYKLYVRGLDKFLHLDAEPYLLVHGKGSPEAESYLDRNPSYESKYKLSYADFIIGQIQRLANAPLSPREINYLREEIGLEMKFRVGESGALDYSSDVFSKIYSICIKYGIAGATYTGRNDHRCALVYDLSNVFPVAWTMKEDDYMTDDKLGDFNKLDYNGEFREERPFISKWSGQNNVSVEDSNQTEAAKNRRLLSGMLKVLKKQSPNYVAGEDFPLLNKLLSRYMVHIAAIRADGGWTERAMEYRREGEMHESLLLGDSERLAYLLLSHSANEFKGKEVDFGTDLAKRMTSNNIDNGLYAAEPSKMLKHLDSDVGDLKYDRTGFDGDEFYYPFHIKNAAEAVVALLRMVYRIYWIYEKPVGQFSNDGARRLTDEEKDDFASYSFDKCLQVVGQWINVIKEAQEKALNVSNSAKQEKIAMLAPYLTIYRTCYETICVAKRTWEEDRAHEKEWNAAHPNRQGA